MKYIFLLDISDSFEHISSRLNEAYQDVEPSFTEQMNDAIPYNIVHDPATTNDYAGLYLPQQHPPPAQSFYGGQPYTNQSPQNTHMRQPSHIGYGNQTTSSYKQSMNDEEDDQNDSEHNKEDDEDDDNNVAGSGSVAEDKQENSNAGRIGM